MESGFFNENQTKYHITFQFRSKRSTLCHVFIFFVWKIFDVVKNERVKIKHIDENMRSHYKQASDVDKRKRLRTIEIYILVPFEVIKWNQHEMGTLCGHLRFHLILFIIAAHQTLLQTHRSRWVQQNLVTIRKKFTRLMKCSKTKNQINLHISIQ